MRGQTYDHRSDFEQALRDYDKSIQPDSENSFANTNRGLLQFVQGELDEALADLDKAIRPNPNDAISYNNCSITHGSMGE